jgi:chorismate dehydratase
VAPRRAPVRVGAVGYLNARPLTWALDRHPDHWHIRYDVPSVCAALLHAGQVDLGLVPSIDYLERDDYRFVPGVGIGSRGPVASVALFARREVRDLRRIALDVSSRTSVALIKVLCARRFHVEPEFVAAEPDARAMTDDADAALLIGDPAFELDFVALNLQKIDLGAEWTAMTGLPFIYAAWTGRAGAIGTPDLVLLQEAQAAGQRARLEIADEYARGDAARAARAARYLRDNVRYGLGSDEIAGLQLFLDYAADLGVARTRRRVEFY